MTWPPAPPLVSGPELEPKDNDVEEVGDMRTDISVAMEKGKHICCSRSKSATSWKRYDSQ